MVALRPYQSALIERIEGAYSAGARRALAVLPTGGGKTHCFSSMIASVVERRERVLILAHRQEIIDQISASLFRHGVAHGAIVPGARESLQPVQVASVATLARRRHHRGRDGISTPRRRRARGRFLRRPQS
jgi:superfamily II DNA or RNA helicase